MIISSTKKITQKVKLHVIDLFPQDFHWYSDAMGCLVEVKRAFSWFHLRLRFCQVQQRNAGRETGTHTSYYFGLVFWLWRSAQEWRKHHACLPVFPIPGCENSPKTQKQTATFPSDERTWTLSGGKIKSVFISVAI